MVELDDRAAELLRMASDAAEADKRGYQRGVVEGVFPRNAKVDVIWPDGTHRYWSTHCRHDHHDLCASSWVAGVEGGIPRDPASCKHCSAPCICDCHKISGLGGSSEGTEPNG